MKNRHASVLVLITCVFAAFTLGFLLGRTSAPGDTIVARASEQTLPPTSVPETTVTCAVSSSPVESTGIPVTTSTPEETTLPAVTESGLININTATLAQLDSLPGIGPVIAQRIIDYREQHDDFKNASQLMLVEGIGEKRLKAIIDLITIE